MGSNINIAITADVADLTAKTAVAKATMADAAKSMKASAASVVAAGGWGTASDEMKRGMLESAEAAAKAAAAVRLFENQARSSQAAARGVAVSAGQQKFAMRDLAAQMQDLGVGFSMATQSSEPFKMAMMTVTQQSSQVLGAIALLKGEATGFLGFLAGPWGAGLMAAASIIANLAVAHFGAEKAAGQQKDAEDDLGKSLQAMRDKAVQATASIEDGIRASLADAFAKRQQAADTLKVAEANIALARSVQAKAESSGVSIFDALGGGSTLPTYGAEGALSAKKRQEIDALDSQIKSLQTKVSNGTETIRGWQAELARTRIEQDAGGAVTARYNQRVSDLAKSYREGSISLRDYAKALAEARVAEQAALASEKSSSRGSRTRSSSGSSGGDKAAREAARAAVDAARAELQERLAVNQQEDALAEDRARTDIELSRIALQSKLSDIETEQRAGVLNGAKAVQIRADVTRQMLKLDQDLEDRLYSAKLKELQANRALYAAGTREYASYNRQIEVLEAQHQGKMRILKAKAQADEKKLDEKIETDRERRLRGVSSDFAGELARMATLQQSFGATVSGVWQAVQATVANVLQQMLADWIAVHVFKLGTAKLEAVNTATAQAALAGAGGVASMAAAPFPLNLSAPGFGAAMYATAAAYGSMASFAAGTNQLPNDMIAQVHAGERIVPRADNEKLLELTRRGAGSLDGPGARSSGGGDGGVHFHFHGAVMASKRELKRWAESNSSEIAAASKRHIRMNGR